MIEDKFNKIDLTNEQLFDLIEKYIKDCDCTKNTLRARECALMYFYKFHEQRVEFYFTPEYIVRYRKYLLTKSGFSKHTVRNYLSSLKLFCDYLALCCVIDKNPVKRIKYDIQQDEVDVKYITFDMIGKLIDIHRVDMKMNYRYYRNCLIPLIMIYTDVDEKAITDLKLRDLNKKDRTYYLKYKGEDLKLDNTLNYLLNSYLDTRYLLESDDSLFVTFSKRSTGQKLSTRNIREIATEFIKKAGFDGSPLRILTSTSILFSYKKQQTRKLFETKYNIKNEGIINRYLEEYPYFIGEN